MGGGESSNARIVAPYTTSAPAEGGRYRRDWRDSLSPPPVIRIKAPAKVNLTLAVLGKRPDGFHELESWVVRIDLCDVLDFAASDDWNLSVNSRDPAVTHDEQNLVSRAAAALARHADCPRHARVSLTKFIPAGAGLGGGSSDAAATLRGLNQLWELNWPDERLAGIAAEIGSDIPFFLGPPSAIMRGRGERIEPVPFSFHGWIGLIIPFFNLATADVYRRFEMPHQSIHADLCEILALHQRGSRHWAPLLFNDLEAAAFALKPELAQLRADVQRCGRVPVRMTGSGSCLFSVFDTEREAQAWSAVVKECFDDPLWVYLAKTA